jgi:uncharacterized membrane protein (UPF0127 family)
MARRPGTISLRRDDGLIVCESVRVADTFFRRLRGLLFRPLKPGQGLVLRPTWSIHTSWMRYPIDVVFLDPDQTVVQIEHSLKPWKTASCRAAREVVELAAGECERHGLEVGDKVAWASLAPDAPADAAQPFAKPAPAGRVLVASHDRRFAKLMRFVLDRHGFEVSTTTRDDVVEILEREGADAVILDAPGSLLSAGRAAAAAKALFPDVEIVVVSEGAGGGDGSTFTVYDKWDGMDDVVATVSRAVGAPSG